MSTLIDYYQLEPNENESRRESVKSDKKKEKLSSTLMKNLSSFKVDESARKSMRAHEIFRPNESESLNSYQLSPSFGQGFRARVRVEDSQFGLCKKLYCRGLVSVVEGCISSRQNLIRVV